MSTPPRGKHNRFEAIRLRTAFTLSELALWLERPRETVRGWLTGGWHPRGPQAAEVYARLECLEHLAARGDPRLPLSSTLSERQRKTLVIELRNEHGRPRVPAVDPTD